MAIDQKTVLAVWQKGRVVGNNDAAKWRQDECGAWIGFDFYGNRNSQYGWEIDHIVPVDKGGSDALSNLRPLQWENNAAKGTGRLQCAVTSNGATNRKAA